MYYSGGHNSIYNTPLAHLPPSLLCWPLTLFPHVQGPSSMTFPYHHQNELFFCLFYICKVCHRLYYFIYLKVNRMSTESFIMLTPIDFLSSVRTFMFEVMKMSKDFPHYFSNTIKFCIFWRSTGMCEDLATLCTCIGLCTNVNCVMSKRLLDKVRAFPHCLH
jgi:hypothetical protein